MNTMSVSINKSTFTIDSNKLVSQTHHTVADSAGKLRTTNMSHTVTSLTSNKQMKCQTLTTLNIKIIVQCMVFGQWNS
jgi:hypothetical protein